MISRMVHLVIVAVLAIIITATILTSEGNIIGQAAMFGMIGCFLLGLVAPKPGMLLMMVLAGYSDFLKRLMVLETEISMVDLTFVLGMAPCALAGVVIACAVNRAFSGRGEKRDLITFGVATLFTLIAVGLAMKGGGGLRAMRVVADYGVFTYMIFVLPILYPTREEIVKFMKFTIFIFVPVAIYGIWQRIFGLADFEHAYLLTGMSIESRQLVEEKIRPFSTLNAASSLTMVAAAAVMLVLIVRRAGQFGRVMTIALVGLFSWCCFMTFTRSGWISLAACLFLIPVLRRKWTTIGAYAGAILGFMVLVWQADFIMNNLHSWQDALMGGGGGSVGQEQGLRIVTLVDRFIGFENMKNPDNWQPFGIEKEGGDFAGWNTNRYSTTFSHDAISNFLFQFGYVPFSIVVIGSLTAMFLLHRAVFRLPYERQRFAQLGLAGIFGMMVSLLAGGTMLQFPSNAFYWLLFGIVMVSIWEKEKVQPVRKKVAPAQLPSPGPRVVA